MLAGNLLGVFPFAETGEDDGSNLNPDPWLADPAPLAFNAVPVAVYRITGTSGSLMYEEMPNVQCTSIQHQSGPDPGTAVFRYDLGSTVEGAPQSIQDALSTAFTGAKVVNPGDRLGVLATRPSDSENIWLFDGHTLVFGGSLEGGLEQAGLICTGVAKRAWAMPLPGLLYRNSTTPESAATADIPVDLIAQFNPEGRNNATPSNGDRDVTTDYAYPVWMDPNFPTKNDFDGNPFPRAWTLPMALANLLFRNNKDQTWVKNPKRSQLDYVLVSREPNDGVVFDPNNSATYDAKDLKAADIPLNNRYLFPTCHELISLYNFDTRFDLSTDGSGEPVTTFVPYLKQASAPKSLYLQTEGSTLDPGASNCASAEMSRTLQGTVNQVVTEGGLTQYEVSIVLAPFFPSEAGDAAGLDAYQSNVEDFATGGNYDTYRTWVADESGEGHYESLSTTKNTTALNLDDVLGGPISSVAQYVQRRRKPIGDLVTLDDHDKPLPWEVRISKDYTGSYPAVWDGTGSWQKVQGGVMLLPDRIGVHISVPNPNAWNIGESDADGDFWTDGIVKAVESIATPTAINPNFFVMLTCIIEGDKVMDGFAAATSNSPLPYVIEQHIDARDRLKKQIVSANSWYNVGGPAVTEYDDSDDAKAEAIAFQQAAESGTFTVDVMIPYLTAYYQIGDRIDQVVGRGIPFRTDNGGDGQLPVYPVVVGWQLDLEQQLTHLTLSDEGLDRSSRKKLKRLDSGVHGKNAAAAKYQVGVGVSVDAANPSGTVTSLPGYATFTAATAVGSAAKAAKEAGAARLGGALGTAAAAAARR